MLFLLSVILYDADGLYAIDSTQHSPLIGFAYDGFPIYGAYGYANTDGTGGYCQNKIELSVKNNSAVQVMVPSETTWPLGTFREDYEYVNRSSVDNPIIWMNTTDGFV